MNVVCINNDIIPLEDNWRSVTDKVARHLTVGKLYEVKDQPNYSICVINDMGIKVCYSSIRFITVEEWRDKHLNELGI